MSRISLKQTAYHEAGHAVMALWLRCRITNVSIVPDDDEGTLGQTSYINGTELKPEWGLTAKKRYELERRALVSLAGNAAESLLTHRRCFTGSEHDFLHASNHLYYLTTRQDEMRAYVTWLNERAKTILSSSWNWFAVETFANELMQKKIIDAKTARKIIRQAWKDSSPTG